MVGEENWTALPNIHPWLFQLKFFQFFHIEVSVGGRWQTLSFYQHHQLLKIRILETEGDRDLIFFCWLRNRLNSKKLVAGVPLMHPQSSVSSHRWEPSFCWLRNWLNSTKLMAGDLLMHPSVLYPPTVGSLVFCWLRNWLNSKKIMAGDPLRNPRRPVQPQDGF